MTSMLHGEDPIDDARCGFNRRKLMTGAAVVHQLLSLVRRTVADTRSDAELLDSIRDDPAFAPADRPA